MSEESLFKAMYQLAEQIKGAPLRADEREGINEEFNKASGFPYEKAITAMTEVLNCKPALIFEKSRALESVNKMLENVKAEAETMAK
ncbi:MAG: hypothetical protein ACOC6B_02505 [Thermodesulfobacteriota bacterium]